MAGNTTGFQKTYVFEHNADHKRVGTDQAVTYGTTPKQAVVPMKDNEPVLGVVTYQEAEREGTHIAVQLDRIAEVIADGPIAYGEKVIVAKGGKAKSATGVTNPNILGEAQNTVANGQKVQVLLRIENATV